jgi:xanthine dehydrogenase accessory factor
VHTLDEQVLHRLCEWLREEIPCWLCTIVATYGSSPRPVGSLFACNVRGETVGSLSGGCVEEDLIDKLTRAESTDPLPQLLEYGVSAEENERLGLPCGGKLEVLLEPLDGSALPHIQQLHEAVHERRYVLRKVSVATADRSLSASVAYSVPVFEQGCLRQVFGPRYRMLLIGAGQLAQTLSELAVAMDYQVIVCDPRQQVLDQWAGAPVELIAGMPDDAVRKYASDPDSIVLTLTHDPRIDDMALMEALEHDLFYVGALGSERTSAARRERLLQLDLSVAQLDKLYAPIGLPIGSKTPMEIAIAILGQLTQLRSARSRAARD